jgi:hypothetical protein
MLSLYHMCAFADVFSVRCFPHVVNIAVQAVVRELKNNPEKPLAEVTTSNAEEAAALKQYVAALQVDPVGCARNLIGTCRSSGQRRNDLEYYVNQCNEKLIWGSFDDGTSIKVGYKQLLRDCPTRWSSTFCMADRLLSLYSVRYLYNFKLYLRLTLL